MADRILRGPRVDHLDRNVTKVRGVARRETRMTGKGDTGNHGFDGGGGSASRLLIDAAGNLFGVRGGSGNDGAIYEFTP